MTTQTGLAYAFCDYKNPESLDQCSILGSLAKQFAVQSDQCFDELNRTYSALNPLGRQMNIWSPEKLVQLTQAMINIFEHCFIVIDAVDEIGEGRAKAIKLLQSLTEGTDNLKIIFTSRDEHDIRILFVDWDHVTIAAQRADLRLYVAAELEERTRTRQLKIRDRSLEQEISERLIESADGMFRYVQCMLDSLCLLPNDRQRRKALDNLPTGLNETYERILVRINTAPIETQKVIQAALKFIALARQPLDITGLAQIIALEAGDSHIAQDKIVDEDALLYWCSSLIRRSDFDESRVELAHFTCKSFLLAIDEETKPHLAPFKVMEARDNNFITKQCLTYISIADYDRELFGTLAEVNEYISRYPLRRYAVELWDTHLNADGDETIVELLKKLFDPSKSTIFLNWAHERLLPRHDHLLHRFKDLKSNRDVTTLHWAALLALPVLCDSQLSSGLDVNSSSQFLGTPLHCALRGESLLYGVSFGFLNTSSLYLHGPERHRMVRNLLAHGADPNVLLNDPTTAESWSPIYLAVQTKSVQSIRALLGAGSFLDTNAIELCLTQFKEARIQEWIGDVMQCNVRDEDRSSFQRLAVRCNIDAVSAASLAKRLFTEEASTPELPMSQRLALLRDAAEHGQSARVASLLAEIDRTKVDEMDSNSATALQRAAYAGHIEVLKALVAHGAKVDLYVPDKTCTALWLAVVERHVDCVEFLLQSGADPELICSLEGGASVHQAAGAQSPKILQLMKASCPNLNFRLPNNAGSTPLGRAAFYGSLSICEYLVGAIPDFDIHAMEMTAKYSYLHLAAGSGAVEKIRFFLELGSSLSECSLSVGTPLHHAVDIPKRSTKDACNLLLSRGAPVNKTNHLQQTALMRLLLRTPTVHTLAAVDRLLQEQPEIDHQDNFGSTGLHYLINSTPLTYSPYGQAVFERLAERNASISIKNNNGASPWSLLLSRLWGVPDGSPVVPSEPPMTEPELSYITGISQVSMIESVIDRNDFDKNLLATKVKGCTLLSLAVTCGCDRLIRKILKLNSELVDLKDDSEGKYTPIEWACQVSSPKHLVKELVSYSKNILDKDGKGCRAVLIAAENGGTGALDILLDHGIDVNYRDTDGVTALMKAFQVCLIPANPSKFFEIP